jgi:hypothetical protein
MTRSRWAATGLLALVFALGALTGGAATMFADKTSHRGGDRYSPQSYAERLAEDLALDAARQRQVVAVIERHQPAMDSIWTQVRDQFSAQRQSLRQDIRSVLTPEQVEKYNALVARYDSLRQNRGKKQGSR